MKIAVTVWVCILVVAGILIAVFKPKAPANPATTKGVAHANPIEDSICESSAKAGFPIPNCKDPTLVPATGSQAQTAVGAGFCDVHPDDHVCERSAFSAPALLSSESKNIGSVNSPESRRFLCQTLQHTFLMEGIVFECHVNEGKRPLMLIYMYDNGTTAYRFHHTPEFMEAFRAAGFKRFHISNLGDPGLSNGWSEP